MEILIPVIILIFSAILHEIMHGVVADKLGDPTARLLGRLTLNPVPHIDPIMSILVPFMLVLAHSPVIFGAAKPVPVNPIHFKDPKKDMALVALAGPLTNFAIAIAASLILRIIPDNPVLFSIIYLVVIYNLMLGFINLIPIPPLDGSKVFAAILPDDLAASYLSIERFGIFILFALLVFPMGPFSLGQIIENLISFSLHLLGL